MRIIVVLEENEASSLAKDRKFTLNSFKDDYNEYFLENIKEYLNDNTGYDNNPIIGMACIEGSRCDLRKHFDYIPNFIGTSAGDYILEIEIPSDEAVFMKYEDFLELESEGDVIPEGDELYREDILDKLSLRLPDSEYDSYVCFIPKIRMNQCKCFVVVSEDWSSEEKQLGTIPMLKVNKLSAFG